MLTRKRGKKDDKTTVLTYQKDHDLYTCGLIWRDLILRKESTNKQSQNKTSTMLKENQLGMTESPEAKPLPLHDSMTDLLDCAVLVPNKAFSLSLPFTSLTPAWSCLDRKRQQQTAPSQQRCETITRQRQADETRQCGTR